MSITDFYQFGWTFCIAYLLLLGIVSFILYRLVKDKSFIYYSLYTFSLLLYLNFYNETFNDIWSVILRAAESREYLRNFNRFNQIVFFTFYNLFVLSFFSIKHSFLNKVRNFLEQFLGWQLAAFFVIYFIGNLLVNSTILQIVYSWIFVPEMILLALTIIYIALRVRTRLAYLVLTGSVFFIGSTALAYFLDETKDLAYDPIVYFFFGVIIENIFFITAIAYRYHYTNTSNIKLIYKKQQSKITGLLEGSRLEKERISEDLHDKMDALMAIVLLHLEHAKNKMPALEENSSYMKAVDLVDGASDEVRNIAHQLMPKTLTRLGFIESVQEMMDDQSEIDFFFSTQKDVYCISNVKAYYCYRMIKECFRNIEKHSNASVVKMDILEENECLEIFITDNGDGFEKETALLNGLGIRNIDTTAKALNGQFEIDSEVGGGTTVRIKIPVAE